MSNSFYIISDNDFSDCSAEYSGLKITIIIYLYYLESIEQYMEYINRIPKKIAVEIYSSNQKVIDKFERIYSSNNIKIFLKKNQGRDISTLLIAAKKTILNSDVICFLHDKKEHARHLKMDTNIWINNLWGNLIGKEGYVEKVVCLFIENKYLGMLVPPDPIGNYLFHWYSNTWMDNYETVKQLSKELGLQVKISSDVSPLGLGTAFWARTDAIKRIFEKPWNYHDFPEEPMAVDGTLNHAIERIFSFVVQDSGYEVKTIMNTEYASFLISESQRYMKAMFSQLQKREHVHNMAQILNMDQREKEIKEFLEKNEKVYIYGAGNYAVSLYHFVRDRNYSIDGFVVSPQRRTCRMLENVKVLEIQELSVYENTGILIGVSYEFREEIESILHQYKITNYLYGY